ncbi:MAG: FAD binding domain-containing protein [Fusobacteriaceae bacterium]
MFGFKNYFQAQNIEAAYEELIKNKQNIIIGGGSYLKMSKVLYNTGIDMSKLNLNYIREDHKYISIGSMTTFREIEINELLKTYYNNIFTYSVKDILGVQFRNNVTVGGTVFSKFGFSDLITPLLTVDCLVVLYKGGEKKLDDFLKEEKSTRDILIEIKIPKEEYIGIFKSIRKSSTDYSLINISVSKKKNIIDEKDSVKNNLIRNIKSYNIAIGAKPGKAVLVKNTIEKNISYSEFSKGNKLEKENILEKRKFILELLNDEAMENLLKDVLFGDNMRSTKEYRKEMAKVLIRKAILEGEELDFKNNY